MIRRVGNAVQMNGISVLRVPHQHGFHRRTNLNAQRFLRYAKVLQHAYLALGRRAAMAAHRRYDEGHAALFTHSTNDATQYAHNVINLAAACRQRHRLARADTGNVRAGMHRVISGLFR